MHSVFTWFAASAAIALVIAAFARQRGWSMSLPVMGTGVIFGLLPVGPDAPPEPGLVLLVILAPLVFGEALGSSYLDIARVRREVLYLAVGLVLLTTAVVGFLSSWLVGMPIALGCALGAVLAPTDAVAVSSIARKVGLPRWAVSILEGESLVNDGSGLTALRVAVVAATAGSITVIEVGLVFVLAVLVGVGVGLAGGWLLSFVIAKSNDSVAANSITLIAPFILYYLAEHFEGSGILAVVVAALFVAHSQTSDSRQVSRIDGVSLWRHVTFVLKAMAFFLVGLELPDTFDVLEPHERLQVAILAAIIVVALIATRLFFITGMMWLRKARQPDEWRVAFVGAWSGARGPVSGMAAFSIPLTMDSGEALPFRNLILATTFGVIVITLVLSSTMGPLARLLKLPEADETELIRHVETALVLAAAAQLNDAVEQSTLQGQSIASEVVEPLQQAIDLRLAALDDEQGLAVQGSITERSDLARLMLHAEQEELLRIRTDEGLPDSIVRPMLEQLEIRRLSLETNTDLDRG
ncbi:MAG: cation:proton antiporter [Candidatus Nanopelagicales bacterium]